MGGGVAAGDVEVFEGCTYCDAASFFSYRRSGRPSGCMASLIGPPAKF
jgi:copper oxidase (laccase) domain-containing protein